MRNVVVSIITVLGLSLALVPAADARGPRAPRTAKRASSPKSVAVFPEAGFDATVPMEALLILGGEIFDLEGEGRFIGSPPRTDPDTGQRVIDVEIVSME